MTNFIKHTAVAALLMTSAAPAFAAAHVDLNSMTCADYKDLSAEDQAKVAMMAVKELNNMSMATEGGNKGSEASGQTNTAEATDADQDTTLAENEGTMTATDGDHGDNDETRMQEEIDVLNRTCDRNIDAMILEAAAGQEGTK